MYRNSPFYLSFHTYFDSAILVLVAKILDLIRRGLLVKTVEDIWNDICCCIIQNYVHYDDHKVYDIKEFGHYFPVISRNPELFIEKRDDYRQMLLKLWEKGKKLFLATNSHMDYADLILTHSIGEDWRQMFDLISVASLKPSFWKDYSGNKKVAPHWFIHVDKQKLNYRGNEVKFD